MFYRGKKIRKSLGAALVEQALLLSLVSIVSISAVKTTGTNVKCKIVDIEAAVRGGLPAANLASAGCRSAIITRTGRDRFGRNGNGRGRSHGDHRHGDGRYDEQSRDRD